MEIEQKYDLKPFKVRQLSINEQILFETHNDLSMERFMDQYFQYHSRLLHFLGRVKATRLQGLLDKPELTEKEQAELELIQKDEAVSEYEPLSEGETMVQPLTPVNVRKGLATLLWIDNRREFKDLDLDYILDLDGGVIEQLIRESMRQQPADDQALADPLVTKSVLSESEIDLENTI